MIDQITPSLEELENRIVSCRRCPRLVEWREEVGRVKRRAFRGEEYWAKPVPGFGDPHARVVVVGLAPGAHGSNRTGRMFTGDASGVFLYRALHKTGFASAAESISREDGLILNGLFITALCRCVPPENKPRPEEIVNCREFLAAELEMLKPEGIVALGRLAFDEMVRFYHRKQGEVPVFSHGILLKQQGDNPWILGSYHPSRQNTQTGRLTVEMFDRIWQTARSLIQH